MRRRASHATPAPVSITSAVTSQTEDLERRTRRYFIQMSIRVVCFFGAVAIDHWTRWVMLAAAVVLPYVAVLLANAGERRAEVPATLMDTRALPSAERGRDD